jgi:hypothetical protein
VRTTYRVIGGAVAGSIGNIIPALDFSTGDRRSTVVLCLGTAAIGTFEGMTGVTRTGGKVVGTRTVPALVLVGQAVHVTHVQVIDTFVVGFKATPHHSIRARTCEEIGSARSIVASEGVALGVQFTKFTLGLNEQVACRFIGQADSIFFAEKFIVKAIVAQVGFICKHVLPIRATDVSLNASLRFLAVIRVSVRVKTLSCNGTPFFNIYGARREALDGICHTALVITDVHVV